MQRTPSSLKKASYTANAASLEIPLAFPGALVLRLQAASALRHDMKLFRLLHLCHMTQNLVRITLESLRAWVPTARYIRQFSERPWLPICVVAVMTTHLLELSEAVVSC